MTFATTGSFGPSIRSLSRTVRNGTVAGSTIFVWKAWLTGMYAAVTPAALNASRAAATDAVEPPMTDWPLLL